VQIHGGCFRSCPSKDFCTYTLLHTDSTWIGKGADMGKILLLLLFGAVIFSTVAAAQQKD